MDTPTLHYECGLCGERFEREPVKGNVIGQLGFPPTVIHFCKGDPNDKHPTVHGFAALRGVTMPPGMTFAAEAPAPPPGSAPH